MTALSDIHPTLLDVAKRQDPDGKISTIAEILSEQNEILDDMVWLECNDGTSHQTTVRTGLPQGTWRKLYGGVQPTKSTTAKIKDSTGMLEAYAEVDKALADLNGNTSQFRLTESQAHVEGMNQQMAETLFYGDAETYPERFTGLAPRYSTKASGEQAQNIVLQDGVSPDAADNSSIYLVIWGANTVHGIYPKGSKAGLYHEDKGQVTIENIDGSNGRMEAYRDHFRWDCGLTVRDWRYVVRIQYNDEDLVKDAASGPDLLDLMAEACDIPPNLSAGRPAWYMNRRAMSYLRRQMRQSTSSSTLSQQDYNGKPAVMFEGIPCRRSDALLRTESGIPTS